MLKTSESHRKAVKKYDEKSKIVSLKYTPNEINEYIRLKSYCDNNGISTQGYIKELVKRDLDIKGIPYPNEND